jgi:DNA-binding NarL/FixJ family response regulator
LRILVADDQEQVRKRICAILSAHVDYEVCAEAANGVQAVELARKLKPELIVLDITMPLMNGLEAARMIRVFAPSTPIVILSIHKSKQLMEEAKKVGVLGYVTKEDVVEQLTRAAELACLAQSCYPIDFS